MAEPEQMYYVEFRANPRLDNKRFKDTGLVICKYWVKAKSKQEAAKMAVQDAANKKWVASGVANVGFTNRERCLDDPEALAAFDYASAAGISAIIDGYDADPLQNN